jgi:single-stranded DNA-binding protein
MANLVILSGPIVSPPFFDFVGERKKPYMRIYVSVPSDNESGPRECHVRCVAYGQLAQEAYPFLREGSVVAVEGHIQVRALGKPAEGGKHRWVTEVVAHRITFIDNVDYETGNRVLEQLRAENGG